MSSTFKLLMISAMYENGGNTTHRFLDGHPQMFVYPFESQLGTRRVVDELSSMFPVKYRWPVFDIAATPEADYRSIIDEECKVRARTPHVSKFRHHEFELDDDDRCAKYVQYVQQSGRSRANNLEAFFRATFDAWKDYSRSGKEEFYVGYSPIVGVDGDKILSDFPSGHVLHIVRNPWSAYADTKKRPVPLSLKHYITAWNLSQYYACNYARQCPDRFHILRIEDVMADSKGVLGELCEKIGISGSDTLGSPSWNGKVLEEVYPWGTIRSATPQANRETAEELSASEREEIAFMTEPYLEKFDYKSFL